MPLPKLKGYHWILIAAGAFLVLIMVLEITAPRKPDWKPGFERRNRDPLGVMGFYKLLSKMRNDNLDIRDEPIVDYYEKYLYSDFEVKDEVDASMDEEERYEDDVEAELPASPIQDGDRKIFLYINERLMFDQYEMEVLMNMVRRGDIVFMSAAYFSDVMMDSLGLRDIYTFPDFDLEKRESIYLDDSIHFRPRSYNMLKLRYKTAFSINDSVNVKELGYDHEANANFVIVRHGKGYFYLHGHPTAFTNVVMADKGNYRYAFQVLSYLPKDATWIWDDYYKTGRLMIRSPLRYIFRTPALRMAWYLLLAAGALFMLFYGKRRQRAIPIVKPPENSSLEFAEILGSFYLHNGNHADIIRKKMTFFADFIQKHYMLRYQPDAPQFAEMLSRKSGVSEKLIARIISCERHARANDDVSESFLMDVNSLLEKFYTETGILNQTETPNN